LALLESGVVKVKPMISHEFPLEKVNEAFKTQLNKELSIKVLVKP